MLPERKSEFSPEENEEIGRLSIEFANLGEDAIDALTSARLRLMGLTIKLFEATLHERGSREWARRMEHEGEVVGEVIARARAILKIQGLDRESELERELLARNFGYFGDNV